MKNGFKVCRKGTNEVVFTGSVGNDGKYRVRVERDNNYDDIVIIDPKWIEQNVDIIKYDK